jgi:hypothetical protein
MPPYIAPQANKKYVKINSDSFPLPFASTFTFQCLPKRVTTQ